jgi:c-di-GMP-binding flagellar brake protein YcgR
MNQELPTGVARAQSPMRVLDLSAGGAAMDMTAALQEGATHNFALDLGGETLLVRGEVVRCRPADPGPGHRIGVRFVGLDSQDQRRLQEYVRRRESQIS